MGQHSGIGVLDKAVEILDAVAVEPLALAALVDRTSLPRATAHRLAVALETHQLLSRDHAGRFVLGSRFAVLAGEAGDTLADLAAPILAWLRDEAGESAQLYRREGRDRVCIAVAERTTGLRTTVPVGCPSATHRRVRGPGPRCLGNRGPDRRTDRPFGVLRPVAGRGPPPRLGPIGGSARGRAWPRCRRPCAAATDRSSPPCPSRGRSSVWGAHRANAWPRSWWRQQTV